MSNKFHCAKKVTIKIECEENATSQDRLSDISSVINDAEKYITKMSVTSVIMEKNGCTIIFRLK